MFLTTYFKNRWFSYLCALNGDSEKAFLIVTVHSVSPEGSQDIARVVGDGWMDG